MKIAKRSVCTIGDADFRNFKEMVGLLAQIIWLAGWEEWSLQLK
jgi:hypothetical protein